MTIPSHLMEEAFGWRVIGSNIITSCYISDYDSIERSWKERLFTLPWRPWLKTRSVYSPKIYKLANGDILCSHRTFQNIKKQAGEKHD